MHDPAGGISVCPHVHVTVSQPVVAQDRADMGAVVVAVMKRLYDHDSGVQLDPPPIAIGLVSLIR